MFYKIIGYVKKKGEDEWQQLQENAIVTCPNDRNPYEFFQEEHKKYFDYWLVVYEDLIEKS